MTSGELREKFLKFFEEKGHTIIPSASLIPENDPTVLFTTAGMHPLVPFLLGEKHPGGEKLTNYQPCIRTDDIDEVGDNTHLTFFEMLGNWSLGNYFKDKAIKMSFEFLTSEKWLKLDKKRLAITIFESEDGKIDEDAKGLWLACGIPEVRIKGLKDNWWGPAGLEGPCGPDTEMFYWASNKDAPDVFDPQDKRWVEIWNDVFMEFYKRLTEQGQTKLADGIGPKYLREGEDYTFESLKQKNVDTGMGLERALAIINDKESVYETDLFLSIISKILSLAGIIHDANDIPLSVYPKGPIGSNLNQEESIISVRVMADHIKAVTFLIAAGLTPSNKDRGYILRRLIRRIITRGKRIGISKIGTENFLAELSEAVISQYALHYPELEKNHKIIIDELNKEETKFRATLTAGLRKIEEYVVKKENVAAKFLRRDRVDFGSKNEDFSNLIPGKDAFDLYQNYGFPPELLNEELARYGMGYHKREFEVELKKHQELSRTASAGMFKGGLADTGEIATRYHTATHLLLAALRQILGPETYQKGSNITAERLRFDFNYSQKLTEAQIKEIEDLVNQKIQESIPVEMAGMPKNEAIKIAKISFDPAKYGDIVKVYKIGDFSVELCGGPHVKSTAELGKFKIIKEEASSSGVRRIRAVLIQK